MSHSGRSRSSRSLDVKIKDADAARAQMVADNLACEAWNERLMQLGGPIQPSPSLRAAINGDFPFLRLECRACQQSAWLDLRKVRRVPETQIWQLEGSLACSVCRRGTSFPPRPKIEMLCEYDGQLRGMRHEES